MFQFNMLLQTKGSLWLCLCLEQESRRPPEMTLERNSQMGKMLGDDSEDKR